MDNLESLLARELRPVAAPAELWGRVEMPRAPRSRVAPLRWAWAAAAAVLVAAFAWGLRSPRELRSSDPAEIRVWARANAGIDVPLAARTPARLAGARLAGGAVEISYSVDGFDATLRVAKAEPRGASGHGSFDIGARTASWVSRGLRYTLACSSPEALQVACRLCHG